MPLFGKGKENSTETNEKHLGRLEKLLSLSHKIHSTLELDTALIIVLDAALELTQMQRGFIMLFNSENELEFRMGRDKAGKTLTRDEFQVSTTVIQRAIDRKALYYFVTPSDISSQSMIALSIGSGFCVPLFAHRTIGAGTGDMKKMIGVLYEDSRTITRFGKPEEDIANTLALHAALALENASLYELATLDGLTRIFQRRYFDAVAEIEWKRTVRHNHAVSILMADIDHFKSINDTYGHDRGDVVLRQSAQLLKNTCRVEDIVARYGGEEFAVLLTETDLDGAKLVARRISESFAKTKLIQERVVTMSMGLASYPTCEVSSINELIKFADEALYQAKNAGRNRVIVCNPTS